MTVPAYPKIHHLGSAGTEGIFEQGTIVQEKADGSQFGFGIDAQGVIHCKSKRLPLHYGTDQDLFKKSVASVYGPVISHQLRDILAATGMPAWFYGEAIKGPKHSTITYDRAPQGNIMLFDALIGGKWASYEYLEDLAEQMGVEVVPLLYDPEVDGPLTAALIQSMIYRRSILSSDSLDKGVTVEGVVMKNYSKTIPYNGLDQPMFVKVVRPEFKERNKAEFAREKEPGIQQYLKTFASEGAWRKAVQHAVEEGEELSLRSIGPLIKRVQAEVLEEEATIKEELFKLFKKDIARASVAGFPEWFKGQV